MSSKSEIEKSEIELLIEVMQANAASRQLTYGEQALLVELRAAVELRELVEGMPVGLHLARQRDNWKCFTPFSGKAHSIGATALDALRAAKAKEGRS